MNRNYSQILSTIDLLNTVNGGISEPQISIRKQEDGHELRVKVPGVAREMLQVEIDNNMLTVLFYMSVELQNKKFQFPKQIFKQELPYFIEITGIHASFIDDELIVKLPFNELSNGFKKTVPIQD